jgi:hypothetical protein
MFKEPLVAFTEISRTPLSAATCSPKERSSRGPGCRESGVDGPIRKHYLVTEFDTGDESRHVTEVCWPVFQSAPSS